MPRRASTPTARTSRWNTFATICGLVGQRVRRLKARLPKPTGEVAEALLFRRPLQTPGVAVLYANRLELHGIALIDRIVVPLADIASITEVRWFNRKRLWWKRGFELKVEAENPLAPL